MITTEAGGPLRIIQMVENLNVGGLERFALQLAVEQRRAGHESLLYCLHQPGALAETAEAAGLTVRTFGKTPGMSVGAVWQVARALRHDRPDVLHMHNPGVHHYGAAAAKLAGVPAVVNTRHGVTMSSGLPFQERYFRVTMPLTGAVVFVSDHSRRHFEEMGVVPPAKSHVVLNGIDLNAFAAHQAAPGAHRPRIRIGTLGRMVAVKGHSFLLEAFAVFHRQRPESELWIAGGGPLREQLEQQAAKTRIEAAVRLQDAVQDVPAWLAELDIFAFPSLSEGLPMVILEAMAAGLPIVTTPVGGVPEVAPEGSVAWYAAASDSAELARQLEAAAAAPDLADRGGEARRLAWERFGIERTARAYQEIYRRLILNHGGRP